MTNSPERAWVQSAIGEAIARVGEISLRTADFPHITRQRVWQTTSDGVWTGGFWAGLLWLAYDENRDPRMRARAEHYTDRLLPSSQGTHNHDLGFMFFPSAIKGWQLTGRPTYRDHAIAAAQGLAGQFNSQGGFIPGWGFFGASDWSGSTLIDTLMNLPLLVWAVGQGADRRLLEVVRRHAAMALRYQLRDDGSVFHMFRFDPQNGAPIAGDTYQGYGADSAWSRGHAWAITGLAILASMTNEARYRHASERVLNYFARRLPADHVAAWDFDAPGAHQPRDSSATAIASYGCQKLFAMTGDSRYLEMASTWLRSLYDTCANRGDEGGLLLHATADLPHGLGVDESTMYGDYYYLKSLIRLKGMCAHA